MKLPKYKIYLRALSVFLMGGLFFVGASQVNAVGDAYFPQNTDVTFSTGDFVIVGGSDADTVTTTALDITITISNPQSFTFKSSDGKHLGTTGDYTSKTCTSSESTVVITPSAGDPQRTVIITPSSSGCTDTNAPSGGGGGGGGTTTVVSTPTPTPTTSSTPTPTPATTTVTPTPTPTPVSSVSSKPTPASRGFVSLIALGFKEGDTISASGSSDPDIYIPNVWGYKRLFLNPAIFNFYGHLGGFSKVKNATSITRDKMVTSGLYRNCETNDQKVYGVEISGEDSGILHWVNTTGTQAVADDPNFFKKVFCINTKEFNWYPKGSSYTSVNQVPDYSRNK